MEVVVAESPMQLGQLAGSKAAELIKESIQTKGTANIILATGTSQFETLSSLASDNQIKWNTVTMFHLDEYIGLSDTHPASFRKYIRERFIANLPELKAAHWINGEAEPEKECERLGEIIAQNPIDVALVGIGENGHLAFNDPPADFETEKPYIVVELDEICRKQQLGEGWFKSFDEVPRQAISMSIKQILRSKYIICSVPDKRKAMAVKNSLEKLPDPKFPASILQQHSNCVCYLDPESSSYLSKNQNIKI